MILEAHVAYYIPALSKHDIKPFLKIETFLRGFAGCCFFQKLPPEDRLNHETYVSPHTTKDNSLKKRITNDFIESKKQYLTLGPKFFSDRPIKNWEIENVKV